MQLEAVHQLAIALSSSPRLFACVLGSGVSRSAGIPTGWQIVLELVRKRAALLGEAAAAEKDPDAWHVARFGRAPDYSELVTALAPTADLRRNLLEPHFTVLDGVTGERHEHRPTDAHRAIAKLVRRGLVRVVITTNFDRLMEQALREAGVARVEVVSSEAAAGDCYPFHASEAFVLKLHGDWRDVWVRNSRDELAKYPPALARLLQRVVDEHGLIVSGWSGDSDLALREAIGRRERRFPVYWSDPRPGEAARARIAELGATHVALGADEFFGELELASAAWQRQAPPPPLSDEVLVARARRMIADEREMELEELVEDATRGLCGWIEADLKLDGPRGSSVDDARQRAREVLASCEEQARPLARLLATLGRYRQSHESAHRAFCALLESARTRRTTLEPARWWWLGGYPALLCAYSYGIAGAFRGEWRSVIVATRDAGAGEARSEVRLPPWSQEYFSSPAYAGVPGVDPGLRLADRIADWTYELVRDWVPRREDFVQAFDRFDLVLCVLSLRPGREAWRPRCSRTRPGEPPERGFEALVERWLIDTVERSTMNASDDPLDQVFVGIDDKDVYERIRGWNAVGAS